MGDSEMVVLIAFVGLMTLINVSHTWAQAHALHKRLDKMEESPND